MHFNNKQKNPSKKQAATSLVVQRLGLCIPVSGKMVAAVTFLWLLDQGSLVAWSLPRGTRRFSVQPSLAAAAATHTGQLYDHDDYRQLPFVGCQEEVNESSTTDG